MKEMYSFISNDDGAIWKSEDFTEENKSGINYGSISAIRQSDLCSWYDKEWHDLESC